MSQLDTEVPWNFPIDIHFTCTGMQGWPKVSVQVWQVDAYGRKDIAGYGMTYLPMPGHGEQEVEILTWRPTYWHPSFFMRLYESMRLFFMGGIPVLRDNALIHGNEERFKLHTIGSGTVKLKLNIISRGFKQTGMLF
ncbi:b9 domain-containing protein 2 [Angomonas deanei]|nr:b9 domain-containing protein 2 [Angomonas deanei]|eukprot:EPY37362.1 b9 domain-containing protein 2 [Angomonas deanei]